MFSIITAQNADHYKAAAQLFREYADSLDFTLSFQNFDDELTMLPEMYGAPDGTILLVEVDEKYVGVAGVRRISGEKTCEVKRMFIQSAYQRRGVGKALMQAVIEQATALGYETVKLDTLGDRMPAAVRLYESFGFTQTKPYNFNPHGSVLYFEKSLL